MEVGIITPRYPPTYAGGGEISAQLLAEQFQKRDEVSTVEVITFDGSREEKVNGVTVRRLSDVPQYPYTLPNEVAYRKLQNIELDFNVLHGYNMHLHPAIGRVSNEYNIPAVATLNAYPLLDWKQINVNPSLQRRMYEITLLRLERPRLKRMMRNIDIFLPLSGTVERVYREHGFEEAAFRVIPNMIDSSFTVPNQREKDPGQARLLYVGYLRDSKGVRYLIDSMRRLPNRFTLRVVGDGPKKEALMDRAARNGVSERVTFTGKVPYEEVAQEYADADVFVHPGVWPEPFGRTVLEAMQASLPVVATNIGGPSETVPQPELRCTPADPVDLSESIKHAYENRESIGRENETLVRQEYHPDTIIPQFLEVYSNLT